MKQLKRIPIQVGASHIEKGVTRSISLCPLALALRDGHCKNWAQVHVHGGGRVHLLWDEQGLPGEWRLSPVALTFVTLFDSGQKIAAAMLAAAEPENFYIERV